MTQQTRTVVFIVFAMLTLVLWQQFVIGPRTPKKKPLPDAGPVAARLADAGDGPSASALAGADAGTSAFVADPAAAAAPPPAPPAFESLTDVETPRWTATFTSRGAGLSAFTLKGDKHTRPAPDGSHVPVSLVRAEAGQPAPLALTLVPATPDGTPAGTALVTPATVWQPALRRAEGVTFVHDAGGLHLEKTVSWKPDGTGLSLGLAVSNPSGGAVPPLAVSLTYPAAGVPQGGGSFLAPTAVDILQPACHLAGAGRKVETKSYDADELVKTPAGSPDWVGVDERYFLAAMAPVAGLANAGCALGFPTKTTIEPRLTGLLSPVAGGPSTLAVDLYLGPKNLDELRAAGHELEAAVDFGFFGLFAWPLVFLLKLFQGLAGNWGLAIVLLTLTVKLVTLPLTNKQMHSMEEMRRLGPHIEELKKKYGGDQQKLNVETMNLYKEHGVQPLGGCLPMLVQMPVWFALYATLQTSFELYNEPFIAGWIGDLTSKDPYYVLPVAMVITMVVTQLLTPTTGQTEQMKTMLYVMPVVFGLMMLSLPAGLVLYIFTNNLLSIGHTTWFRRAHAAKAPPAARSKAGTPAAKSP